MTMNNGMDVVPDDLYFWLKLVRDRRWSRRQKSKLLVFFGSPEEVFRASKREVGRVLGEYCWRQEGDSVEADLDLDLHWVASGQGCFIHQFDSRFSNLLSEISDPPIGLFVSGDIDLLNAPSVSIVGSRKPTPVGMRAASEVSGTLASLGVCVVSGLALGIDGVAHSAALDETGPSIAVLGCGLDIVYPSRHRGLYSRIREFGLLVSEYPLGFKPTRYSFPDRNRLVSGLSEGVVIVEAAERSGTLITARHAVDQNREVMVVPGPALSTQYAGSHQLIRDGAALVCNGNDVLNHLSNELLTYCNERAGKQNFIDSQESSDEVDLSQPQKTVFDLLDYEPMAMDAIIAKSSLTAAEVSAILLELELRGCVATTIDGGHVKIV